MKTVELFAGAGGLAVGLARAGFETVYANDIDPHMCGTFSINHPTARVDDRNVAGVTGGDILEAAGCAPGEIDLVAGGPPCQGFSTVGKKRETDPRNSLPFHFVRLVHELRPRLALLENVAGFRRLYGGRVFEMVMNEFVDRGYNTIHGILDAADYGVPQHRLRTFVLASMPGIEVSLPEPTHGPATLDVDTRPYRTLSDALSDLPLIAQGEGATTYRHPPQNDYQADRRTVAADLLYHEAPRHGSRLMEVMRHVPPGGSILDVPERLRPKGYFANTYARLRWEEPATTITRNFGTPSSSRCIHPLADRGLTTREGARLQSFDDGYRFAGPKGSQNLQIGNAVPPLLAEAVGSSLWKALR